MVVICWVDVCELQQKANSTPTPSVALGGSVLVLVLDALEQWDPRGRDGMGRGDQGARPGKTESRTSERASDQ